MGHRLLGELPQTKNWRKIIDLLRIADDPAKIIAVANRAGFRCFTTTDEFKQYVEGEILVEAEA